MIVFCQEIENEDLDFPVTSKPFEDEEFSKIDINSEIREDEEFENSYLESYTKKEEINFDCDFSSINLDISRNTQFCTDNTKILNDFEKDDNILIINSARNGNEMSIIFDSLKKQNIILHFGKISKIKKHFSWIWKK